MDTMLTGVIKFGGGAAMLAGASIASGNVGTLLLVLGVVAYGVASWRRDTREILRRQNEDLATRNATVENENAALAAENRALKERPDVGKLAEALDRLEVYSKQRDEKILAVLDNVSATIVANTDAVRLWATQRAGD